MHTQNFQIMRQQLANANVANAPVPVGRLTPRPVTPTGGMSSRRGSQTDPTGQMEFGGPRSNVQNVLASAPEAGVAVTAGDLIESVVIVEEEDKKVRIVRRGH